MTQPLLPLNELLSARGAWLQELREEEAEASARLEQAYKRVIADGGAVDKSMQDLIQRITEADDPSMQDIADLQAMQDFLGNVRAELDDYSIIYGNEAAQLVESAAVKADDSALAMSQAQVKGFEGEIAEIWNAPAPNAIANVANVVDNDIWRARQAAYGENAAQLMSDTILSMVAQGKNPRFIARQLENVLSIPFAWAQNTVRTAQIYSYRQASHLSYANNARILDGWVWQSALDRRTCMSCISQHGNFFPVTRTLNDHHQGRCTPLPVVKGTRWRDSFESGEDWYRRQPEADRQAQVNNKRLYDAIENGDVRFGELSQPYTDDIYGEMWRQASYKSLKG